MHASLTAEADPKITDFGDLFIVLRPKPARTPNDFGAFTLATAETDPKHNRCWRIHGSFTTETGRKPNHPGAITAA